MTKYPDEAPVFELLEDVKAPIPVGEAVVFVGWDGHDGIEALHAWGNHYGHPCVESWFYYRKALRPLTKAARIIYAQMPVQS